MGRPEGNLWYGEMRKLISSDMVEHFERRRETLKGKAMIVCMSREICVGLYNAITKSAPGMARFRMIIRVRSKSS